MRRLFCAVILMVMSATPSSAMVVDGKIVQQKGNGRFVILNTDKPFSVGQDNFNTDHLYAFDEDQNILLSEPIRVDIGGTRGVIAQGQVIASHYVFFDSVAGVHQGYVDFDSAIMGIAAFQGTLAATDFLANNAVNYIGTELRGLERGDRVWIDPEKPNRLWVLWAGSSPGDYIRVFTEKSVGAIM